MNYLLVQEHHGENQQSMVHYQEMLQMLNHILLPQTNEFKTFELIFIVQYLGFSVVF